MVQSDKIWWEQTRAKGRTWFILRHGILPCSLRLTVAFVLIAPALWLLTGALPDITSLLVMPLILSVPLGAIVGVQLWRRHESDYACRDGCEV